MFTLLCLSSRAEDSRVFGKVSLRQRDHHATGAWFGDGQANSVADHNLSADPVVLHKPGSSPPVDTTMFGRNLRASKRPCGYSSRRRSMVEVVSKCTTAMSKNVPAGISKSVTVSLYSRPGMSSQYFPPCLKSCPRCR